MKKLIYILLLIFLITACGEENPTEIFIDTPENDDYDIELLSKSPDDYIYSEGIDSTGNNPAGNYEAHFSVNMIKNSYERATFYSLIAQAVFNDLDNPVYSPSGRFLGFSTQEVQRVFFNNQRAHERPFKRRFMDNRIISDTLLGPSYAISRNGFGIINNPVINFGEEVEIKIVYGNSNSSITTIAIPEEITASVTTSGTPGQNFSTILNWNGLKSGRIQIILYGVLNGTDEKYPLARITTSDDGNLILPQKIFKNLPFNRFKSLVFTFLRETKKVVNGTGNNELFFASNNIHNIGVPLN